MRDFIESTRMKVSQIPELKDRNLSVGFSDDSLSNIRAMTEFMEEERQKQDGLIAPSDKVRIYFTGRQSESQKLEKA